MLSPYLALAAAILISSGPPTGTLPLPAPQGVTCPASTGAEKAASTLIVLLASNDSRSVQFALDSLRLTRNETVPFLVCQLENVTPVVVREVYWLNPPEHFELSAHYQPRTVGEAVAIVLGDPPGSSACSSIVNGGTPAQRRACVTAWRGHRRR
jgi:hypothetical protein